MFLGVGEDLVLGHELVVSDVHQELFLHEHLESVWSVALQRLNGAQTRNWSELDQTLGKTGKSLAARDCEFESVSDLPF